MIGTKNKFRWTNQNVDAIVYMIGQSVSVFSEAPKIRDVADWMGVSKPTANRHLRRMESEGCVRFLEFVTPSGWRVFHVVLTAQGKEHARKDAVKSAYQIYAQRVMGIILQ